jgi:MFS family permease
LLARQPALRRFIAAVLPSYANQWVLRVAQDWLVLQLTDGSGLAIGLTTALQFAPSVGGSLWGGALADRLPKIRILIAAELCTAVVALALGLLTAFHLVNEWHVYLTALAVGVSAGLATPARQTFVADLVPGRHIGQAVSLVSTAFAIGRILGPAGYGILASWGGTPLACFACAAGAVLVGVSFARLPRIVPARADPVSGRTTGWSEGVRYVCRRADIVVMLVVLVPLCALGWNSQVTIALMARNVFGEAASGFAVLGTMFAIGSVVGTVVVARWKRPSVTAVLRSGVVFAVMSVVAGWCPTSRWFGAALVALGASALVVATLSSVTFQLAAPGHLRGRVVAVYLLVTSAATGAGAPLLGWIGQTWGPRWTYGTCGIAVSAAAMVGIALVAGLRRLGLTIGAQDADGVGPGQLAAARSDDVTT